MDFGYYKDYVESEIIVISCNKSSIFVIVVNVQYNKIIFKS